MRDCLIIIPTYNEASNIRDLLSEIREEVPEASILVVDDNSPDGTGRIAEEFSQNHGSVTVVHRPGKLGLGTAYLLGFTYGLEKGFEHIMTMDGDLSHQPKFIPRLLSAAKDNHVVIGSRYIPDGGTENWSLWRRLLSRGANLLAKTLLGLKTNDNTSGFRCYSREALQGLNFHEILSDGYSFLLETAFLCQQKGMRIKEVPIIFVERRGGRSKISRREIYKALFTLFTLTPRRFF